MLPMTWSQTFVDALKDNEVKLVTYVPDNVLTPLITGVVADNYFTLGRARRARTRRSASSPAPGWAGCAAA